jgi:glycosyltransferase involved in cell wall biosynthesis
MTSTGIRTDRPKRISAAIIAMNEEDRIVSLLDSLNFVDEIVVVDSGSTDNTVKICERYGANVIPHEWMGYVLQKQFAMDRTSGEWILCLDADEAVSVELRSEITEALNNVDDKVVAFSIPRLSRYLGKWIYHGGWYPDRKVRLVRRGKASWVGDSIHEKLEPVGITVQLSNPILHYVYRDISDQVKTINAFSSVVASGAVKSCTWVYVLLGVFHSIGKFLECAIWKKGLLDGVPGLIIAINSSFYVFLKHAKIWERKSGFTVQ